MLIKAKVLLVESFQYADKKNVGVYNDGLSITVSIDGDPLNYRLGCFGKEVEKYRSLKKDDVVSLQIVPDRNFRPVVKLA